ncbi:MAG: methyl-accepting chemotaxis protein [Desulforhopalus sp.]|nr:methyl-accepting chemotaxis protein [Desulforhopalus sp.]
MKIKMASIKFRLVAGGITLVLLPLVIISVLSTIKSSTALSEISKTQAKTIASDLALLTDSILSEEMKVAQVFAADEQIVDLLSQFKQSGAGGVSDKLAKMYVKLGKQFSPLGEGYQGIFVSDSEGNLLTGVLEGGKEYKGSNVADRGYFQAAKATGKTTIGDISRSKTTDKLISVICVPVKSQTNDFIGAVGLVLKVEFLTKLVSSRKIGQSGYGFMTDKNGIILAHPVPEHILSLDVKKLAGMEEFVKKLLNGEKGVESYNFKGVDKIAGYAPLTVTGWYIAATQDAEEILMAANSIRNLSLIVSLVAMALTIVIVAYAAGLIVKPLNRAIVSLKDIAEGEGDLTMRLDARSKDEVGELGFWFNTFIEKLQGIVKKIAGNSVLVDSSSNQLSAIAKELSSGAEDTSHRAANVATASEEMSANLNNVAAAMEQSSTNTNMVASAAEEMTSTINEIAENAERAKNISSQAVAQATSASEKMQELGKAAEKIGKVTETITEISEQTNLLALNATIEAARAGDAGKGFAVVANEIKDLAKQTAQATLDIKSQIDDVQRTTKSTVVEINQISEVISGVNDIVATIAAAVEEQSAATKEIANNISQASQGIQEVNENVSQSSAVAGQISQDIAQVNLAATGISGGSKQVQTSSEDLQRMAKELNAIVGSFKV